jgi:hypothetical protein
MPLSVGTKLGPDEILVPIGAGGMGEVYKMLHLADLLIVRFFDKG